DSKRKLLEALLTPAPERSRAQKIHYLAEVHPIATSFRTVCDLRPVFESIEGREEITGYLPAILLEAKQITAEGEESQVILHLSPASLKQLGEAIERAEKKLAAIRRKHGDELLGEMTKE